MSTLYHKNLTQGYPKSSTKYNFECDCKRGQVFTNILDFNVITTENIISSTIYEHTT